MTTRLVPSLLVLLQVYKTLWTWMMRHLHLITQYYMMIYNVVRKEIWYRPDMFFYRDMLFMLARNKKAEEARQVWADLRSEEVLFDQHTYGDIVRAFTDGGLLDLAMEFYDEMRSSPDPPLSLPFRVMLKGLIPYPELREKMKEDFLELFPNMIIYDPPENLSDDEQREFPSYKPVNSIKRKGSAGLEECSTDLTKAHTD